MAAARDTTLLFNLHPERVWPLKMVADPMTIATFVNLRNALLP